MRSSPAGRQHAGHRRILHAVSRRVQHRHPLLLHSLSGSRADFSRNLPLHKERPALSRKEGKGGDAQLHTGRKGPYGKGNQTAHGGTFRRARHSHLLPVLFPSERHIAFAFRARLRAHRLYPAGDMAGSQPLLCDCRHAVRNDDIRRSLTPWQRDFHA